jgi:hypothetical protein
MSPETLKRTKLERLVGFGPKTIRVSFERLTLTLSKKGWSASVQWEGTTGARGRGMTPEDAIAESIKFAKNKWGCDTYLDGYHVCN